LCKERERQGQEEFICTALLLSWNSNLLTGRKELLTVNGFKSLLPKYPGILDVTCFFDDAWFLLSGHVKLQDMYVLVSADLQVTLEEPVFPQDVEVWCVLSPAELPPFSAARTFTRISTSISSSKL
jgi:hypothetical protein